MTPELPNILDRYFAAQNVHDIEAMVACFSPRAKVRDEGHDYVGRDSIRAWKADTSAKYHVSVEPLELRERDGLTRVTAKVSGNFPGSPAHLTYSFGIAPDGLIGTLEVQ